MARMHSEFEWDDQKAAINLGKHGVGFKAAAEVLADTQGDRFHLVESDDEHEDEEDRFLTTASHPVDRRLVLVICWTDRSDEGEQLTRIISARKATRREILTYGEERGG